MWALFYKELSSFFSTLTGYVVLIVFLILNGLFLWVFPGAMNLLDNGTASLWPFFNIAPWVLLFLIPAITMRSFAEEKKAGTLDLLYTRPISDLQIIMAKYLSALALVILAILPTALYYVSIVILGDPAGNIDHGATWGSYIGLFFLAATYIAIGIFTSTITENIIVAFLLGVFLCFAMFSGFDYVAGLASKGTFGALLISFGIDAHYQSLSRGVIDSRDVIYFLSVIVLFTVLSNLKLNSNRW